MTGASLVLPAGVSFGVSRPLCAAWRRKIAMWQMRRNSVVGIIDGPRWDGCTTTGIAFLPRTQTAGFITGSGHAMLMLPRPFALPRTLTLSEGDALYFRIVKH